MAVPTNLNLDKLEIDGITEPTLLRYFAALNAEQFADAAALFTEDGALYAPFEPPIIGQKAIATYLEAEAKGMKLYPRQGTTETVPRESVAESNSALISSENNWQQFRVTGKVETPLFGVNVAWQFLLDSDQKIAAVKVKLLASPQELLQLRR